MPARILSYRRRGVSPARCPACGAARQAVPCLRGHADGQQRCPPCGAVEADCARCAWDLIDDGASGL